MSAKRYPLLRFSVGVRREPAIEIWLDGKPRELGTLARRWFDRLRACGPDVRELLHDGFPTACVEDAPFDPSTPSRPISTSASSMAHRSRIRRVSWRARGSTCGM